MSELHFDNIRNLAIGTVDSISAQKIEVLLEANAPQATAINTGIPTSFPRINNYVLIPNEAGAIVGIITWLGTKQSPYPNRKGNQDVDLIDLPFPLRKMIVRPLGTLKKENTNYLFGRGVYSYPSIGDFVILPTSYQLESIVENHDENAHILMGKALQAANAPVRINPDKLFGRHCAILGNTGSGKSCTVAGLIRWSLEAAKKAKKEKNVNARFIVLDPNGEYLTTFDDGFKPGSVRKFAVKIQKQEKDIAQLKIPAWLWNSAEWASITRAQPGIQLPLLKTALRNLKYGNTENLKQVYLGRLLYNFNNDLQMFRNQAPSSLTEFSKRQDLGNLLFVTHNYLQRNINDTSELPVVKSLENVMSTYPLAGKYYPAFGLGDIEDLITAVEVSISQIGYQSDKKYSISEDIPIPFNIEELPKYLGELAANSPENLRFVDTLINRLNTLLNDIRIREVIKSDTQLTLEKWLDLYMGKGDQEGGEIIILDLSLVPVELIDIIVSVIGRLIFEAIQRYKRSTGNELPTVLVLEEAHTFISKNKKPRGKQFVK